MESKKKWMNIMLIHIFTSKALEENLDLEMMNK